MSTLWSRIRHDDRGAGYLAAFIVLFGVLTLGGAGVLVDSARVISAERHASSAAFEAARAGAQAINVTSARGGATVLDPSAAETAARRAAGGLLAASSAQLASVSVTATEVIVTVTSSVDPWFPLIAATSVSETGRARIAEGVVEEDP